MADAIQAFSATWPAGNGAQNVLVFSTPLGESNVSKIIVSFPPGCAGLVGIQVQYADNPVYPIGGNQYFIFDDYNYEIDVTNQQTGGQWRLSGYNMDYNPHLITVYYEYDYLPVGYVAPSVSSVSL